MAEILEFKSREGTSFDSLTVMTNNLDKDIGDYLEMLGFETDENRSFMITGMIPVRGEIMDNIVYYNRQPIQKKIDMIEESFNRHYSQAEAGVELFKQKAMFAMKGRIKNAFSKN